MGWNRAVIGMEFGSTRIKAVLLDENHIPVCAGGYDWSNELINGVWTYSLKEVHKGMQACYQDLARMVTDLFEPRLQR